MLVAGERDKLGKTHDANRSVVLERFGLVAWILVCFSAAAAGAFFPPDDWYANLVKPAWSPPDSVFAPVWALLYLTMAVAAWLVWKHGVNRRSWLPLTVFMLQLALNAAWSWLFFGLHRIDLAMLDIVCLFAAIVATVVMFYRSHRLAGLLLVPYLAWVAFAMRLNFKFWGLNA